jgi:hypothetical protein
MAAQIQVFRATEVSKQMLEAITIISDLRITLKAKRDAIEGQ